MNLASLLEHVRKKLEFTELTLTIYRATNIVQKAANS